jgi:hypothetical protein
MLLFVDVLLNTVVGYAALASGRKQAGEFVHGNDTVDDVHTL